MQLSKEQRSKNFNIYFSNLSFEHLEEAIAEVAASDDVIHAMEKNARVHQKLLVRLNLTLMKLFIASKRQFLRLWTQCEHVQKY